MSKLLFILAALKDFKTIGSPMPSQKFLIKKMTSPIRNNNYKCIVELGAGEGCISKEIIKNVNKKCLLISFEIKKELAKSQKAEKNHVIVNDDAINLSAYLKKYNIKKIDCVISSLPLAQIKKEKVLTLLSIIKKYLKESGFYIQYQYSLRSLKKLKSIFPEVEISFVPLNFPPAFVYTCRK